MPFAACIRFLFCLVILYDVSDGRIMAQNLVDNYSFEILTNCPTNYGGQGATIAPPWWSPSFGSPDIFNECTTNGLVDVPDNWPGSQTPITGVGYAGVYTYIFSYEYREYLMQEMLQPLVAGTWYEVSFYVSPGEDGCTVAEIGARLTRDIPWLFEVGAYGLIPPIESNQGLLDDYEGWTLISGCYKALGGERYLTVGNFRDDANTTLEPVCDYISYYYIEDVSVVEITGNDELPSN